ncbi:MAG: pyruvate kinase [Pseudobdellovibrionaceae bacterium]|nr:pyruvate kinase [Pseudobdellovibrionaceae bacterium]
MRHTKILATLGPATESSQQIEKLLAAGVDAIRLNFSHGTHDWHRTVYKRVRSAAQKLGRAVAIVQDLQGPKIRLGLIQGNEVEVAAGASLIITTSPIEGTSSRIPTSYSNLPRDVTAGDTILIDEGRIRLTVESVQGTEIHCLVVVGGTVASRKGIHIPGVKSNIPSMTDKDRADVEFGLALGVDFIALSFVKRAPDVEGLRDWMRQKGKMIPIISKIETTQAIEHLDEIVDASDGVMVARGDLGVESSLDLIPYYQKKIIQLANQKGKLVITATQMLESMIVNNSPTRAEITDIANSILDGTDVMMLSGETAMGKFPIQTVEQMATIAATTERTLYPYDSPGFCSTHPDIKELAPAMVRLIGQASLEFKPKAIAVFT